ncbi:patatin-like phospholipase family protein [Bacillus timonensis]|nr:patatin-like phospholipase family protein [Bacillus timonensis]
MMKMLCIDGGGIRGIFAVSILQELENELNIQIKDHFDVIAGTSTGSIIAASIVLNKKMDVVHDSYTEYGEKIFFRQAKVGIMKSVYSDRYLRHFIRKAFGEYTLGDITHPLLIPTVDVSKGKPYVYRSNYDVSSKEELDVKLWDAVLSSCSAPVYFPPNILGGKKLSIDGGLWANNPSLVCLTEGIHHFKKDISEMKILSIGTGEQKIDFSITENNNWGVKEWLPFNFKTMKVTPKLIDLALHLSSESVSYHCKLLLKEHYLRINKNLGEEIPFDEVGSMEVLSQLGKQTYREEREKILSFIGE